MEDCIRMVKDVVKKAVLDTSVEDLKESEWFAGNSFGEGYRD